jgi:hypothetical protein
MNASSAKMAAALLAGGWLLLGAASHAGAHCDTLDGPVVKDAKAALAARDVAPVLKWVRPQDESPLREAFARALEVRTLGRAAGELADRYFFETLVRLHRSGEGAPFEGLKPAGTPIDPGIEAADAALESGSADQLVELVSARAEKGLRERLARTLKAKSRASESPEQGRLFVAAYVELTHYAERLAAAAGGATPAHAEHAEAASHGH